MMNGGALYTDISGNLPELSGMSNFVVELTRQLESNREVVNKINRAADRVILKEQDKIQKLRESYKRHGLATNSESESEHYGENSDESDGGDDNDDNYGDEGKRQEHQRNNELKQKEGTANTSNDNNNNYVTEERAPRVLGKEGKTQVHKTTGRRRQSKEIQRRRGLSGTESNLANGKEDDEYVDDEEDDAEYENELEREGDGEITEGDDEAQDNRAEQDQVLDTQTAISRENLNLRIELQRLEVIEVRMADLIKRFEHSAGTVKDGSQNYMREYNVASQSLVDSYESRLQMEKTSQQKLLETRSRMLEELANLQGIVGQTSTLMGNDIAQRLDDDGTFINYSG